MDRTRRALAALILLVGIAVPAAASQRLMLFEYFSNTS